MDKYFADHTNTPANFLTELNKNIDDYYEDLNTRGRMSLWRTMYGHNYRAKYTGGRVNKVGEQLEFKSLNVNHLANIVQHQVTQITQQKIAWDARAVNTNIESEAQAKFSNALLDAETNQKRLDDLTTHNVFLATLFQEGWMYMKFNPGIGDDFVAGEEPVLDQMGQPQMQPITDEMGDVMVNEDGSPQEEPVTQPVVRKTGDIEYFSLHPVDVARDVSAKSFKECQWFCIRTRVNRYDLAADYPELADKIMAVPPLEYNKRQELLTNVYNSEKTPKNMIYKYEFFHKASPAVKGGRYTCFVGTDVILQDSILPIKMIPLFRVSAGEEIGTPFGWTNMFEISSIQDALNKLYSIVATNQLKWGVGVVFVPKGSTLSASTLQKGMVIIEYDPRLGKPEPANFTLTPPEVFNFIQQLEAVMEKITSVSSVMRGDPEANIRSGNMLDTILAQNTTFYKGLEKSYNAHLEEIGTCYIEMMRTYADYERPVQIMGEAGRYYTKYFKKDDFSEIDKIYVQRANPAQKTYAGRMTIANNLLTAGALKDPREYINIANSGNLESATDPDSMDYLYIKEENSMLTRGELPQVSLTDYHAAHGYHHTVVTANPEARANPQVNGAVNQHLEEHAFMVGFILPPQPEPQLDEMGNPVLDEFGQPFMVMGQPKGDVLTYLNWCRMIMNAPPSGALQVAQQAMMGGANGMAPPAPKLEKPNTGVEK